MQPDQLPPAALLRVQDLAKSYGKHKALGGVSFLIEEGERVALLGPNGAGKSTLLQLLTGLFSPDRGLIEILGHNLRTHPGAALACMGVVFQQSALDLELSVRANLLFHTDLHGLARKTARARIDDGLRDIGLLDKADHAVRQLSGGTRRKVELLRALLHRPRVLLMDEASIGLDPASRAGMLESVRRLAQTDRVGVLWATHLIEEISQM
ncbi:MAG: ATP-binding cassette domain-containing protein, partial [Rhodoferax sp.]|nr:ATP-binding cassette domain-containing protein [Rhodoferax sp.]